MKTLGNIHILTRDEYGKKEAEDFFSISFPDKSDLVHKEIYFLYCIKENQLVFIDDSGKVLQCLEEMEKEGTDLSEKPETVFCEFLEHLTKDDFSFLQSYEQTLSEIEESLMHYNGENISAIIIKSRKELLKLQSCYYRLIDLGDKLKYGCFVSKMERLLSEARELREYSLQIRELYQTQIAVRQNKIMQLLTMVTTIFMPLTLLTGWYGMNFQWMPEISWKYGYIATAVFSLLLILLEIWFFKRRKWFL
jgi:magnesium transporter